MGGSAVPSPSVPCAAGLSCSREAAPRGGLGVVPCPGEHERGDAGHRAVEPQEQRLRRRHPRPLPTRGGPEGVQEEPLHLPEDVEERPVYAGGLVGLVGHGNEVGVGATDGLQAAPHTWSRSKGSIRKEQKMAMDSSWATSSKKFF